MARKAEGYWEKRSTELMKSLEKTTENTINDLIRAYERATRSINKEITKIFNNYAKDGVLNKNTLKQLLTTKETDTYYKNLLSVINNNITDETIKKQLLAKYNAPAYSYRISRYEVLQKNIDIELKKLANIEQQITENRYTNTIKEGYYHTIFDIQKGTGLGFSFSQIDNRTIKLLLNEIWIDNANFSQRIWKNSEKLSEYLRTQLTADTLSGKLIQRISKELSDSMNVGMYNAVRLVRTEVNHFANESEMIAYEELDIEKYRFIATLDNITCEHCAELDNKVFKVKDRKAGGNYPPIHSNDRCTTVAEFDDEVTEGLERRAKDKNGKSITIPQNMNYQEWKNKYIVGANNKLKYEDITNNVLTKTRKEYELQEQQYFIDEKGNKYIVDDKYVVLKPTEREKEVANMLGQLYGGTIKIIPRVNEPSGIKTPDYMVRNKKYDLKQIKGSGKYVIQGNIKDKQKQADNFIIDITKSELNEEEAIKQIQSIYNSKRYLWVDRLMLIKNKEFLKIYKRK